MLSKMNELDLKREIILDHYENPKNKIEKKDILNGYKTASKDSPSCIDNIFAHTKLIKNKIVDIKFSGIACAIATSSTDIMIDLLKNKTISQAKALIKNYFLLVDGKKNNKKQLGDLYVFDNIHKQPNRINCAKVGIIAIDKTLNND